MGSTYDEAEMWQGREDDLYQHHHHQSDEQYDTGQWHGDGHQQMYHENIPPRSQEGDFPAHNQQLNQIHPEMIQQVQQPQQQQQHYHQLHSRLCYAVR